MIKEKRFLITTADERTWKFDRPVIFLGEWCRLHKRKHIWQHMDAIIAEPYGLGKTQKDLDFSEARTLENELFPIFCNVLNKYHGTQYDERFWKILLGHWFRRYVEVMFNRIKTLDKCIKSYQLSGTIAFSGNYSLAPLDSNAAVWAFNDDQWNSVLYARILNFIGFESELAKIADSNKLDGFHLNFAAFELPLKRRLLKWGHKQLGRFLELWAREDDAVIVNSYLPKKEQLKLELTIGQIPQLRASGEFKCNKKADYALRQSLCKKINNQSKQVLSTTLYTMIFELLPVCYLEGFDELIRATKQLSWPENPKFIFTSNNFDTDEIFKLWTAMKVSSGSKYIIGQHGNNYGTYRFMFPSVEEEVADKFLTWGWSDGTPHTPAFIFKTVGSEAGVYDKNGGILLIELCLHFRITIWDRTYELANYLQNQMIFVDRLAYTARKKVTIRLHAAHRHFKWNEVLRWREFDNNIKLEMGVLPIKQLIANSRLVIHSYDATGMLETLSQNIPTLAFWQGGLDHLRDSAKSYYQLLVDVGIIHFSSESAADKVNEVWDDVDKWWTQVKVQEARRVFCERYASISQTPIHDLKTIFKETCNVEN